MKFLPCECSNALACTQPSIASQVPQLLVDYSTLHLEGLENDSSSLSPSNMQHFEMRPPQCKPLSLQGSSSSYSRRLTVPYQPIWLQEPLLLQHPFWPVQSGSLCSTVSLPLWKLGGAAISKVLLAALHGATPYSLFVGSGRVLVWGWWKARMLYFVNRGTSCLKCISCHRVYAGIVMKPKTVTTRRHNVSKS